MKSEVREKPERFFATFCLHAFLFLVLSAQAALAQVFEMNNMPPPSVSLEYDGVPEKGSILTVTVTIPETWHVNANVKVDEFLKPSRLELKAEGITFGTQRWPTPKKDYNEALDFDNLIFEGTFRIEVPVEAVEAYADPNSTTATFHYQACSKSICLAPNSVTAKVRRLPEGQSSLSASTNAEATAEAKAAKELAEEEAPEIDGGEPQEAGAAAEIDAQSENQAAKNSAKPEPQKAASKTAKAGEPENSATAPVNGDGLVDDSVRAQDGNSDAEIGNADAETATSEPQNEGAKTAIKSAPELQNGTPKTTEENPGTAAAQTAPERDSMAVLLLFAFLGGCLLNLMPCVLPVLSLKIFAFVRQAHESRARLFLLGMATTGGILASFWVIALAIVLVRSGGGATGWGMQFQSPSFMLGMAALLTLFAMSFFGAFEVWLPGGTLTKMDSATRREGLPGAFFTGALLVLLSTPCSAPFLGTAMGFAFNETVPILFLFFTAAGLGLALPYIIVSFCPTLLSVFPKPGAWMVTLKKIMGVLLFLTVAWLLWLGNSEFGAFGLAFFALVCSVNVVLAFCIGKFSPPYKPFYREVAAFVIVIGLNVAVVAAGTPKLVPVSVKAENGWLNFTETSIAELQNSGHAVLLDVTADWCLTCKANEAAVLSGKELGKFLEEHQVKKVKADWTHSDAEVTKLLRSLGRSGVPAYAVYPPNLQGSPAVLPEILTESAIREAVLNALSTPETL